MLRYTSSSTISPQWTTFRQSNVQRSLQLPPESTLEAIPCSLLHFHELCATSVDISPPQPTRTFVITIRIAASKFGRSTFSIGRMRSCMRQIGSRGRGRGRPPLASTRHLRSSSDLWSRNGSSSCTPVLWSGGKGEITVHAHGPSRICVYRVRDDCIINWKREVVQRYFEICYYHAWINTIGSDSFYINITLRRWNQPLEFFLNAREISNCKIFKF